MTDSDRAGRVIPADRFGVRLAVVRAEMGWNLDEAQRATGVSSESWRLWERGRHCSDVIGVSRKVAEATAYDEQWLAFGGPLVKEDLAPRPRKSRRPSTTASTHRVTTASNREWMRTTRGPARTSALNCDPLAA